MSSQTAPPPELPKLYIQMDEEGYFSSQGQRIVDEDYGRGLMESMLRHESGAFMVNSGGTWALLEAFDEPLMVQFVEKQSNEQWKILLPYGAEYGFSLNSLTLDDWDRFHGRTQIGLPFVFSRKAQAQFFNLVDEYEDDAFVVDGKKYATPYWMGETPEIEKESFWSEIYNRDEKPGWDLDGPAAPLPIIIPQLKIPKSRVLILGAGRGHDAAYFAELGHIVTAVDMSPLAIEQAKERYGHIQNLSFHQADLFNLPEEFKGQFDLIFEHTLYCAIPPQRRSDLVKVWKSILAPRGHVLGVFFTMDKPQGPPFGGSEWELRQRLKASFDFLYWTRWRQSLPRRHGLELIVYAQRKD